jgi:hypothetical protein
MRRTSRGSLCSAWLVLSVGSVHFWSETFRETQFEQVDRGVDSGTPQVAFGVLALMGDGHFVDKVEFGAVPRLEGSDEVAEVAWELGTDYELVKLGLYTIRGSCALS